MEPLWLIPKKPPNPRRYFWNVFPGESPRSFRMVIAVLLKRHQTVSPSHWPTSMNSIRGRLPQFRWPRQLSVYGSPWPFKKGTLPPTISKIDELWMEHKFFKRGHGFVSGFSQTRVSMGKTFVQSAKRSHISPKVERKEPLERMTSKFGIVNSQGFMFRFQIEVWMG